MFFFPKTGTKFSGPSFDRGKIQVRTTASWLPLDCEPWHYCELVSARLRALQDLRADCDSGRQSPAAQTVPNTVRKEKCAVSGTECMSLLFKHLTIQKKVPMRGIELPWLKFLSVQLSWSRDSSGHLSPAHSVQTGHYTQWETRAFFPGVPRSREAIPTHPHWFESLWLIVNYALGQLRPSFTSTSIWLLKEVKLFIIFWVFNLSIFHKNLLWTAILLNSCFKTQGSKPQDWNLALEYCLWHEYVNAISYIALSCRKNLLGPITNEEHHKTSLNGFIASELNCAKRLGVQFMLIQEKP
jgi:hypothetical protein